MLCPNKSLEFSHPAGFRYRVTTDERGERSPPSQTASVTRDQTNTAGEVWLLGDSIAMGFGNDDQDTLAYRLARSLPQKRVRNLGVDSLGACGIHSRYRAALDLARHPQARGGAGDPRGSRSPGHTIWIFNPSDYADDPRDLGRRSSALRSLAFRLRVWLTRRLALPDALRLLFATAIAGHKNSDPLLAAPLAVTPRAPADPEHPTYACARAIFELGAGDASQNGRPFLFLVYPDVDRRNGRPLPAPDPLKAPMIALAREFPTVQVLDLQVLFERNGARNDLYLPQDGHPGPGAQRLFHLGVRPLLD